MTLAEFKALASLHDRRVRMTFSDGEIVVAQLLCISTDLDDSRHVIYDMVEWSSKSQMATLQIKHATRRVRNSSRALPGMWIQLLNL